MNAPDPSRLNPPEAAAGRRGGFVRSVMVLVSGTALAHGITAAAMPILSRLYSPADFGLLAVFSACLGIVSAVACLRFERAIALPASSSEAADLLWLSVLCCLVISAVLALPALLAPAAVAHSLGQPALAPFVGLLPLGFLLAGCYSALQFWHVREKHFGWLAKTRIGQSAGSAGAQIGMGVASAGPIGLLIGQVMNTGIACVALSGALRRSALPSWTHLRGLIYRYRRFPMLSAPEALANAAALQLPVILIAGAVAPAEAGYLSMAMFVIQAPMSLMGTAVSQVFLSQAPQALREQRMGAFTTQVLGGLFKTGAGPLLAIGLLAPLLFPTVFGAGWERAGWLVTWMTPWFLAQFLAVPLSMSLHVCGRQREALLLQIAGMGLRVGLVLVALRWAPSAVAEIYSISGALFYVGYLLLVLHVTGASVSEVCHAFKDGLSAALGWVVLAGGLGLLMLLLGPAA